MGPFTTKTFLDDLPRMQLCVKKLKKSLLQCVISFIIILDYCWIAMDLLTGATCRICYSGSEDGSLFTPCRCSGTLKFVHRQCLEKWRASGTANAKFECPQCRYRYTYSRHTKLRASVDRKWAVPLLTLVFFFLIWTVFTLLSYHSSRFVRFLLDDIGPAVGIWNMQNMQNSLVLIGLGGLVYSFAVNGDIIFVISNIDPLSSHSIFTFCIFIGLCHAIAAIHSAAASWLCADGNEHVHYVLDICDVESSEGALTAV